MENSELTLAAFGERRMISELLSGRYGIDNDQFGDDVALVSEFGGDSLVVTTDPAPVPVAWNLGLGGYYEWGWLLSALNLSDLAAAGAAPVCLLTSLTLPIETSITQFTQLLDGIDDCCRATGTRVVGGNLKESPSPHLEATAVGRVQGARPLSRTGAQPGDVAVSFGPTGAFWSAVLLKQRNLLVDTDVWNSLAAPLVRPKPQLTIGRELRSRSEVHSCTDASDGIYGAILDLSVSQGLGFVLQPNGIEYSKEVLEAAAKLDIDPIRLALGFGNLELVAAVNSDSVGKMRELGLSLDTQVTVLGTFDEEAGVRIAQGEAFLPMRNFDNERFTEGSQFTAGLDGYEKRLLGQALHL